MSERTTLDNDGAHVDIPLRGSRVEQSELMTNSAPSKESPDQPTFEEDLERLKSIVDILEDEPESLQQALELYEEGVSIARRCMEQLEEADLRIQELSLDAEESFDA